MSPQLGRAWRRSRATDGRRDNWSFRTRSEALHMIETLGRLVEDLGRLHKVAHSGGRKVSTRPRRPLIGGHPTLSVEAGAVVSDGVQAIVKESGGQHRRGASPHRRERVLG
jgi:hypothetical protein